MHALFMVPRLAVALVVLQLGEAHGGARCAAVRMQTPFEGADRPRRLDARAWAGHSALDRGSRRWRPWAAAAASLMAEADRAARQPVVDESTTFATVRSLNALSLSQFRCHSVRR